MGCGGSKFSPEGEAVPVRLRPILGRRIEEIRRRRNANTLKGATLSKKELLEDAGEEDESSAPHDSIHVDGRKSVSSPEENVASLKEPLIEADSKVPESDKTEKEDDEKKVKVEEVEEVEVEDVEGELEEEEIERMLRNNGGYLGPGSPSFRVYYIDTEADSKNDGINDKSLGDESGGSGASRSTDEGSVSKIMKKGKKGSRFRRVMPKGGPVAVKNLLNVKSCYHPPCSSRDNTSLLTQKAAA